MSEIGDLAATLDAPERTLRRCIEEGLIRAHRVSPRRLEVTARERHYLKGHWGLLSVLRHTLRTERGVRLAVVFGSVARGDDRPGSDIDLLVELAGEDSFNAVRLASRLSRGLRRDVQTALVDDLRQRHPTLLATILREGRVVVDRDASWPRLQAKREQIERDASREALETRRRASAALRRLERDDGRRAAARAA